MPLQQIHDHHGEPEPHPYGCITTELQQHTPVTPYIAPTTLSPRETLLSKSWPASAAIPPARVQRKTKSNRYYRLF